MLKLNLYAFIVALIPLLYITWIKTHQAEAISLLAELKRRCRRWIIKRHGEEAARLIEQYHRARAGKNKFAHKAIDIFMAQERERMIEEHGTAYADQFLGPPDVIERDF